MSGFVKIPKIPPGSFLDFKEVGETHTVIARGEGTRLRHLVNLIPGLLLGLVAIALLYFSFDYLLFGNEYRLGTFAIGLVMTLFTTAFALCAARDPIQAAWGSVTLTIDPNGILRIAQTAPVSWLARGFTDNQTLRIVLNDVREVRMIPGLAYSSRLLVREKPSKFLPMCVHDLLSCRSQCDLKWLQSWIESHRQQ